MVTKIVVSGDKVTVKQTGSITNILGSIKSLFTQPEKGTKNPPHIQHGLPKSVANKIKQEKKENEQ